MHTRRRFLASAAGALAAGCGGSARNEVVAYCALDREFSEPVLNEFERTSGIRVRAIFDTEATKSVGLAEQLKRERERPRCDVFWNNEILNTLRLHEAGLLQPYASPSGRQYPAAHRAADDSWFGFAARARVLLVNTKKLGDRKPPSKLEDLVDPQWKGQVAVAKPLFGTTATQIACLFAIWGEAKAKEWLRRLKANGVQVVSGNKQSAVAVGGGQLICGLTDSDDAAEEVAADRPAKAYFLDQEEGGLGSLVLPNTVSLIRGAPRLEAGRMLIDFLLTPAVETMLAKGASRQIPLHPSVKVEGAPRPEKATAVDFEKARAAWDDATAFVRAEFAG